MFFNKRNLTALTLAVSLLGVPAWSEAADLNSVRYHSGSAHDRVVFDWSAMPRYNVTVSSDKRTVTLDFYNADKRSIDEKSFSSSRIEKVSYTEKNGHLLVTVRLKPGLTYKVAKLANPARVFIDVLPQAAGSNRKQAQKPAGQVKPAANKKPAVSTAGGNVLDLHFDGLYTEMVAPGLARREYVYWDDAGQISAYFIEADKNLYKIKPVLARGRVPGLQTTSGISDMTDAVAAVNATYFAGNGDAIGMVKEEITPQTALNPISNYGKSKAMAEGRLKEICSQWNIYRFSPVYTEDVKRDIQKRYYLKYPDWAYLIGGGQQFEVLNVRKAVASMVEWVDRPVDNTIHIIKDEELLDSAKVIASEREEGRAKHVLRLPRFLVVMGYYCLRLVFGKSNKTYLVFKALWPFRTV